MRQAEVATSFRSLDRSSVEMMLIPASLIAAILVIRRAADSSRSDTPTASESRTAASVTADSFSSAISPSVTVCTTSTPLGSPEERRGNMSTVPRRRLFSGLLPSERTIGRRSARLSSSSVPSAGK